MKKTYKFIKIATENGYDYYRTFGGKPCFNLVHQGEPKPMGGYYNPEYICKIKGVPNLF